MKKSYFAALGLIFFLAFVSATVSATLSEPSYCCEKTIDGGWCVNDLQSNCDPSYLSTSTSCETTSYCKTGTCYDSEEGICMENTPQRVCNDNGGTWDERDINEVPQCQLGCCIIADQAAFVSLVRCKRLSSLFGVENNYDTSITDEVSCIATAQAQDMGACVYESDFERLCDFTTRADCGAGEEVRALNQTNITLSSQRTFYKDYLCSAEELGTSCAKETSTTCYNGDVYWVDSCGNRENVYSSDKDASWNNGRVLDADKVCNPNDGTDINCGNCDYLLGTRCAEFDGLIGGPSGSDYYCQKTECVDGDGKKRMNGESWCVVGSEASQDSGDLGVGSRYYREICTDGEVVVEPCADYRNEVCLQDSVDTSAGKFQVAACRVNRWQDCYLQTDSDDCLNTDKRDCKWMPKINGMAFGSGSTASTTTYSNPTGTTGSTGATGTGSNTFSNPTATGSAVAPVTGDSILGGDDNSNNPAKIAGAFGVCVPMFPPGFAFWEEGSASKACALANAQCTVVYTKKLYESGYTCKENCECLDGGWAKGANAVCNALGDCGGAVNYAGEWTDDGYTWTVDGAKMKISPSGSQGGLGLLG